MRIPTASPQSLPRPRWSGSWPAPAIVAGAGFGAFALSIAAAGALYQGYSHVREGISALAATDSPSAWVMIAGFLALAVATVSTGVTLWVRLRTGIAGRIGARAAPGRTWPCRRGWWITWWRNEDRCDGRTRRCRRDPPLRIERSESATDRPPHPLHGRVRVERRVAGDVTHPLRQCCSLCSS